MYNLQVGQDPQMHPNAMLVFNGIQYVYIHSMFSIFCGSCSSIAREPLAPDFGPEELQIEEEVPEPKLQEPLLKLSSGFHWTLAASFNDEDGPP